MFTKYKIAAVPFFALSLLAAPTVAQVTNDDPAGESSITAGEGTVIVADDEIVATNDDKTTENSATALVNQEGAEGRDSPPNVDPTGESSATPLILQEDEEEVANN